MSTTVAAPSRRTAPPAPRTIPLWAVGVAGWTLVGALLVARSSLVAHSAALATFGIIFTSIVVEALPFVLLGALVAAAMAVYVPDRAFTRFAALPGWLQVPGAAVAGIAFPLCECGSVPVGRRLVSRVDPAAGVAFMLAAPLVNPIVILSTFVAFGGGARGAEMVAGRSGFGLVLAAVCGWLVTRGHAGALRARCAAPAGAEHEHDHSHLGPAERHAHFVTHLVGDFLSMGGFLVLGAALSAGLQTAVPQDVISGLAGSLLLGSLALMALAFVLCLCSEADAFVAISFTAFPRASQLGFLLLGPLLDLKLSVLYSATFGGRFVSRLAVVAVPLILVWVLLFGAVT